LKLAGAFHCVKTSRIRFWAFSYSIGDPCGRSNQLSMYFIGFLDQLISGFYSSGFAVRDWRPAFSDPHWVTTCPAFLVAGLKPTIAIS
jgi:hypothetical protein